MYVLPALIVPAAAKAATFPLSPKTTTWHDVESLTMPTASCPAYATDQSLSTITSCPALAGLQSLAVGWIQSSQVAAAAFGHVAMGVLWIA